MQKLTEYMVNESAEFSSMENNPLIYTLIIPKVLNGEKDVIKNVIDVTEKFIKSNLDAKIIKLLKGQFRPGSVMDTFKLSKNLKATFDNYFTDFRTIICNEETNFIKCLDLDKKLQELFDSPEYQLYRNTL